ncbi:MAG: nucleotidyl transferase AbiEii/AbiGii toxin family protein [bacterium]|nr:nucleotidyl transferase AbiEii/AbiGii toxin family protein [bacterium]
MYLIYPDKLPLKTRTLFLKLADTDFIRDFYLAGGTAIALFFAHRESNDLDFFTTKIFSEPLLIKDLNHIGTFMGERSGRGTLLGTLDQIKVSFFVLPYGLIEKPIAHKHLLIAQPIDLAAMKILAISDRGKKRDFIDLYYLATHIKPLDELFWDFQKKFGKYDYNLHHIIKSLVYFEDADNDEMPKMYIDLDWKIVKQFFINEKPRLAKKFLTG